MTKCFHTKTIYWVPHLCAEHWGYSKEHTNKVPTLMNLVF